MSTRPQSYSYETSLSWQAERRCVVDADEAPSVGVSTDAYSEFWNPETLLLAAVDSCVMNVFLAFSRRPGLTILAYDSSTEGRADRAEDGSHYAFASIVVRPKVTLAPREDVAAAELIETAKETFRTVETRCLITHSLACQVEVEPQIEVSGG